VKIALASLDQAWEDKSANLRRCRELCGSAAERGADFVVFPEMTLTGFTMRAAAVAEPHESAPTTDAFAGLAREHELNIAFGVVLQGEQRPLNSLVVVDRTGSELARYAKIHPFSFVDEDEHYDAGDTLARACVADTTFGLTVCYDLRFPELYSSLAADCEALLVIANWPERRIEHWYALLRARAIDSQAFVVGVNRTGTDENGIVYPRSSRIYGPLGDRLQPEEPLDELEFFTIDPAVATRYRTAFPILRDRRPDLYPLLSRSADSTRG
jgi:predicted amidohydrolase